MSSNSSSMPRLGPAWRSSGAGGSGRGFQPPPAVPDETRDRSGSHASGGTAGSGGIDNNKNRNPFSLLDDEDDGGPAGGGGGGPTSNSSSGADKSSRGSGGNSRGPPAPTNDRFSALKSSEGSSRPYSRSSTGGARPGGRSLADLAAGLPSSGGDRDHHHRNDSRPIHRSSSTGYHPRGRDRGDISSSDIQRSRSGSGGEFDDGGAKVIRFTREKLLSLRPRPTGDKGLPDVLKHLEGSLVISNEPQDPVCWDTFDVDEVWSQVARERRTSERGLPKDEPRRGSRLGDDEPRGGRGERRGPSIGGGGGRWQRGMSVPENERGNSRPSRNDVEADNPNDLWDDPTTGGGAMAAAADFSAFGGSLEDERPRGKTGMDAFELTDMSKAAAAFEAEMDGDQKDDNGNDSEAEDNHNHSVDSSRPLAGTGTTIRSGSGNNVSVFEDFDEPTADEAPIKSGNGANAASSRLMSMIGVSGTGEAAGGTASEEQTEPEVSKGEVVSSNPWGASGGGAAVSSNPWGDAGGLGAFKSDANETGGPSAQQQEDMLRRQQEEEKKRWEMQAKQEAERQAQQQQQQQQLRQQQQDQVENVLMERVSNILENSWGKSDLNSILSNLHAEDSRVIAILSSIDQLRALISRHPQRIALGTEGGVIMAQLRLNNQQWKVAQAQLAQQKAVQEQQELQRRRLQEEQLRQQQAAQQEALARARALEQERQKQQIAINPNAPWFYADPQGNIQGPFAGDEMKQWLEAGYFKGDLPISQNNGGPFRPLASYFSDPKTAFQAQQSANDKAALEARAKAEAEAAAKVQAAKEAESRRRAEEAAKLQAEENRRAAEAEQQTDQSAQLKMMLGLGGGSIGIAGPPQPEPAAVEQPTKKQQKKKAQQKQVKQQMVEEEAQAPEPASPPAPAWGGSNAAAGRKKTMSEIQQEEAKEAARRAKEQGGRPSGGGWANVAATGGSTAWGGAASTAAAAAVVTPAPVVAGVSAAQKVNANAAWNKKQAAAAPAAVAKQQKESAAAVDNFGANGQMNPAMEKWCKDQMQKLNGSDDLTLVTFCMTLNDSDEIRQYLSAYLGSSPQVNNFATEFIKRKGGDNAAEWESASHPKKGRKKKGGK